jgi:hypothetical protein
MEFETLLAVYLTAIILYILLQFVTLCRIISKVYGQVWREQTSR